MAIHFRYGGSTAKRTIACPGWRAEADKAPKLHRDNSNATRGSALHQCLDECVMGAVTADTYVNRSVKVEGVELPYVVTAEDVEEMNLALDAAYKVMDHYGITEVVTETLVKVSDLIGGSADVTGCGDEWVLTLDWKMGYNYVGAHKNDQAIFYTWAGSCTPEVADMFEGRKQVVAIVQPKVSDEADLYELEEGEVLEFAETFMRAVAIAERPNAPLHAGDHCDYCPAAAYCKEKRSHMNKFLALNPQQTEDLVTGMAMVEAMKEQIKVIEAEVFAALENEEKVPGWKLVAKQSRRHWIDEEKTELMLRKAKVPEQVFLESKLLSVAQLEKALKKSKRDIELKEYFTNSSSGNTIAPESDKRPAVQGKNQMPDALAALMNKGAAK